MEYQYGSLWAGVSTLSFWSAGSNTNTLALSCYPISTYPSFVNHSLTSLFFHVTTTCNLPSHYHMVSWKLCCFNHLYNKIKRRRCFWYLIPQQVKNLLNPSSSSSASLTNTNETDTNESLSSQQKSTSSTNTDNDSNNNSSNISDNSNNFIN